MNTPSSVIAGSPARATMTYNGSYTRESGPFRIVIEMKGCGYCFAAYIRCNGWEQLTPWLSGDLRSDDRKAALDEAERRVSEFFAAHSDTLNRGLINLSHRADHGAARELIYGGRA